MVEKPWTQDAARLERNVAWAIAHDFEPHDLLPMVETLARIAERGSSTWAFANRQLAELVLEKEPWRAAAAARAVATSLPDDDAAHGLLALALTVLGHYHSAARSYRVALSLCPENPWYAHNLGHLLDIVLDQPQGALHWLRRAFAAEPHVEIAASLAHALGRVGKPSEGLAVLRRGLRGEPGSAEHQALEAWLEQGAPRRARSERDGSPDR